MPYRRRQRSQRKYFKPKVPEHVLKKFSPKKRSLIEYGMVPESIKSPVTHKPLTKKLASSAKHERDSGIATVKSLLSSQDNKLDKIKMTQLWQAIFYSFWMSDKELIQHDLARKLANFIKLCANDGLTLLYMECFMQCMEREWSGIDYHRMNKFLSLVRYFMHSIFDYLAINEWDLKLIQQFGNILRFKINLLSSSCRGLFLHLSDIYIEELIKICRIDADDHLLQSFRPPITFDGLYNLLTPFISIYLQSTEQYQQQYVVRKIFNALMESMSFDKEQRETDLNRPGMDDLDLYKYNIEKYKTTETKTKTLDDDANKNKDGIDSFLDDDEDEEDEEDEAMDDKEETENLSMKPSKDYMRFDDESMKSIDPNNPLRRQRKQEHIMFDKKNFDVVMPFKEFEKNDVKKKVEQWKIKCRESITKRKHDPLLMKDKMEQFQKVFDYLANHEDTPKKSRHKLRVLSNLFIPKEIEIEGNHLYYDRAAVKKAVQIVDQTKQQSKREKLRKERKKRMRSVMKHKGKWQKLRKMGIKMNPNRKMMIRSSKIIA